MPRHQESASAARLSLPVYELYLPYSLIILPLLLTFLFDQPTANLVLIGEFGLYENLTVILTILAGCYAIAIHRHNHRIRQQRYVGLLFVFFLLGCIYFAGEELSWGQHFFQWQTSDMWKEINVQDETNLHNTSNWLNKIPRRILVIACILTGFIAPIFLKKTLSRIRSNYPLWSWLLPTSRCIHTAFLILFTSIMKEIYQHASLGEDHVIYFYHNELRECLIGLFLFLYAQSVLHEFKKTSR